MYRILIVEDDKLLAQTLSECFERRLYHISICHEGVLGYKKARNEQYDLLILDWLLPGKTGIDTIKQLRSNEIQTPVLIITTKNNVQDIVTGLRSGSDGYLCKPFNLLEFKTRAESLLKRPPSIKKVVLKSRNLILDTNSYSVYIGKNECNLRKKEYQILKYLLENQGKTITRDQILSNVWPDDKDPYISSVDVHINRLRNKLDEKNKTAFIKTVHGFGYKIITQDPAI